VLTLPNRIPWHGVKVVALFLEVVCFRCQPEPSADHQGARRGDVLDCELGYESAELLRDRGVSKRLAGIVASAGTISNVD
jgi:hypothetical protein